MSGDASRPEDCAIRISAALSVDVTHAATPQILAALISFAAAEDAAAGLGLGMVGTEMLYFAVGQLGLDGGIAVTASHNPKEYTGMKIVRRGALPVGGDSGLLDIRTRAMGDGGGGRAGTPGT